MFFLGFCFGLLTSFAATLSLYMRVFWILCTVLGID